MAYLPLPLCKCLPWHLLCLLHSQLIFSFWIYVALGWVEVLVVVFLLSIQGSDLHHFLPPPPNEILHCWSSMTSVILLGTWAILVIQQSGSGGLFLKDSRAWCKCMPLWRPSIIESLGVLFMLCKQEWCYIKGVGWVFCKLYWCQYNLYRMSAEVLDESKRNLEACCFLLWFYKVEPTQWMRVLHTGMIT